MGCQFSLWPPFPFRSEHQKTSFTCHNVSRDQLAFNEICSRDLNGDEQRKRNILILAWGFKTISEHCTRKPLKMGYFRRQCYTRMPHLPLLIGLFCLQASVTQHESPHPLLLRDNAFAPSQLHAHETSNVSN